MPPSFIPNAPAGFSSFVGSGAPLGAATGTITISTAGLQTAVGAARQAGQQIAAGLNQINTGTKAAEKSFASLSDTLKQIGGAVGVAFGARAVIQFALAADTTATAYKRQSVAALSLAGSQSKLNELLSTYDRVTGGVIDKATQMADVTKLQAVGFADNATEIERFTTAVRGMSVAMGKDQEYITSQLILEMTNQRGARLDQIGLSKTEVLAKTQALQAADSSLTKEIAYQNAVLDVAIGKFGALVKSSVAQATGQEKAAKAWKDFSLELGIALGPATATAMQTIVDDLRHVRDALQGVQDGAKAAGDAIKAMGGGSVGGGKEAPSGFMGGLKAIGDWDPSEAMDKWIKDRFDSIFSDSAQLQGQIRSSENIRSHLMEGRAQLVSSGASSAELARQDALLKQVNDDLVQFGFKLRGTLTGDRGDISRTTSAFPKIAEDPNAEAQLADQIEYYQNVRKIESSANADRLSATTQYESQRSETIRGYEQGIAREAEDFAISRRRAAAQLADTITQIGVDSARQAAKWATDLADSIANMQEDSGKRVAEAQEATGKRLAEINAEYAKSRERAARDHNDTLLEAAANLDARAVFNEQKNYARSSSDAKDAHDKQISDLNDQLKERTQKEAENLADRIAQAQEANAKQLLDAREADVLRIQQAKDALAKQQAQEDEDRALRLQRGAEDQAAQLNQMAVAQAERLAQIDAHAAEERTALDEEFQKQLDADGLHSQQWLENQAKLKNQALEYFDAWWKHLVNTFNEARQTMLQSRTETAAGADRQKVDPIYPGFASGGPLTRTGLIYGHAGEYMLNKSVVDRMGGFSGARQIAMTGGRSNTLNLAPGSIQVFAAAGQDPYAIAYAVRKELLNVLENELN